MASVQHVPGHSFGLGSSGGGGGGPLKNLTSSRKDGSAYTKLSTAERRNIEAVEMARLADEKWNSLTKITSAMTTRSWANNMVIIVRYRGHHFATRNFPSRQWTVPFGNQAVDFAFGLTQPVVDKANRLHETVPLRAACKRQASESETLLFPTHPLSSFHQHRTTSLWEGFL